MPYVRPVGEHSRQTTSGKWRLPVVLAPFAPESPSIPFPCQVRTILFDRMTWINLHLPAHVWSEINILVKLLAVVLEELFVHVVPIVVEGIEARLAAVSIMHTMVALSVSYLVQELLNGFTLAFGWRVLVPYLGDTDDIP